MIQKPSIPLANLLDAYAITNLHDVMTEEWHLRPPAGARDNESAGDLTSSVRAQHRANFELWHLEDEARSPQAPDRKIAEIKRSIDTVNQRRNDLTERCDTLLLEALEVHGLPAAGAPLNSETPGLILDRLSILALKTFHTREEMQRRNAPEGHVHRNKERLRILEQQRGDLAECLDQLWGQTIRGERRFKVYRQLKMYNDPLLNPAVYKRQE